MEIPILIICFNNYKYVEQMVQQIIRLDKNAKIIIVNNSSTCERTRNYLAKVNKHSKENITVVDAPGNCGYNVWKMPFIYDTMPDRFIITDPDIKFNDNLPSNYIETLIEISDRYRSQRVGFALDISDWDKMFPYKFSDFRESWSNISTIWESQKQYWAKPIDGAEHELYYADLDTTFCLYTKRYDGWRIRVAGNFTAKHLPWYVDNEGISRLERYLMYKGISMFSSIAYFELQYLKDADIKILEKRGETILVEGGVNDNFWINIYPGWERETFDILDRFLSKDKQFLDIGAWMGTTAIYASRKSGYVVCVEADPISVDKLKVNLDLNKTDVQVDIESKPIFSERTEIVFGPNKFLSQSKLNDSTSQIKTSRTNPDDELAESTTLADIVDKYALNNLSLIKVDIEGGEENILRDIYEFCKSNKVPAYISFHYGWWANKDLERFEFLTLDNKNYIRREPFGSILFEF